MEELPKRLREARYKLDLTQAELAEKANVAYRTIQDAEQGKAVPGSKTLQAYGKLGIDLNWLVLGRPLEGSSSPPQKPMKIEGKRFRIRSTKLVRIPYYDPYNPDSFDPDNPECAIAINPSKLTAYNLDYIMQDIEWANIASTTVINDIDGLSRGSLVLFDTLLDGNLNNQSHVIYKNHQLVIKAGNLEKNRAALIGSLVFALGCFPNTIFDKTLLQQQ